MPQVCEYLNSYWIHKLAYAEEENCNPFLLPEQPKTVEFNNVVTEVVEEHNCCNYILDFFGECMAWIPIYSCGSNSANSTDSDHSLIFTVASTIDHKGSENDSDIHEATPEESKAKLSFK